MERKTQQGYLFLADITGFTSFLASTELEHANIAMGFLLETIIERLSTRLTINKLEGDAVFAYAGDGAFASCDELMSLVDTTYHDFREKAGTLNRERTCACRACQPIPSRGCRRSRSRRCPSRRRGCSGAEWT